MRGLSLKEQQKSIAERFKRKRKDFLGITQAQAGELLMLGRTSITNIENGKQPIAAHVFNYFMCFAPADSEIRQLKQLEET